MQNIIEAVMRYNEPSDFHWSHYQNFYFHFEEKTDYFLLALAVFNCCR